MIRQEFKIFNASHNPSPNSNLNLTSFKQNCNGELVDLFILTDSSGSETLLGLPPIADYSVNFECYSKKR
jgi:hypothetical protein